MKNFTKRIGLILLCAIVYAKTSGQSPVITAFTPANGVVGSLVSISGSNLDNATTISIGGVKAVPIKNDGGTVVAMVMPGAATGPVSITTAGGSFTTPDNFSIKRANAPTIQQGAKLVGASNVGIAHAGQGVAISADGNTAVIGGPEDNSAHGAVWVFTRGGNVWTQQGGKLVGTGAVGQARQGTSVAISADGNTVLVGAYNDSAALGATWVFVRSGGVWTQQGGKLVGGPLGGHHEQGTSVALSADGNTALIGSPQYGSLSGMTYVFTRDALGVWTQQAGLQGSGGSFAGQGKSVALSADGNTALIGGYSDNWIFTGKATGASWVFTRNASGVWSQQGSKLVGTGAVVGDVAQGRSVALSADGNTAIVGGNDDDTNNGAAWIFTRSGNVWAQQGNKLVGTGNLLAAEQGTSVALSGDGNIAFVGGPEDRGSVGGGSVWVFTRSGTTWTQKGSKLVGTGNAGLCWQGISVAVSADGSTAITGGYFDNISIGAAWVFTADPLTLPVRWLSVKATLVNASEARVEWSTAAEVNNVSFDIERSNNGSSQFKKVGSVPSTNSASTYSSYTFNDRYPFAAGQSYYYRIKQTDIDGRFSYSPVIRVQSVSDPSTTTWQVFPNPVQRNQPVNLVATGGNLNPDEKIIIQLYNATGQLLHSENDVVSNAISNMSRYIKGLSHGVYTISINQSSGKFSLQLLVQE